MLPVFKGLIYFLFHFHHRIVFYSSIILLSRSLFNYCLNHSACHTLLCGYIHDVAIAIYDVAIAIHDVAIAIYDVAIAIYEVGDKQDIKEMFSHFC